jgi:hypothetical protein
VSWDSAQQGLYDSLFEDRGYVPHDPELESLFDETFFEGAKGLEFEYAFDRFEMYLWQEYGLEVDQDFWDDFREWYDSQ